MKTHQEKLNELTEAIRKSIPRLMELSEGCELEKYNEKYKIHEVKNERYYLTNILGGHTKYEIDRDYTIIGHEPLLNHVLEWRRITNNYRASFINDLFIDEDKSNETGVIVEVDWDLSKSKLSDQSEDLINYLHDLIKYNGKEF